MRGEDDEGHTGSNVQARAEQPGCGVGGLGEKEVNFLKIILRALSCAIFINFCLHCYVYLGSSGKKTQRTPTPALAGVCDLHAILKKISILY